MIAELKTFRGTGIVLLNLIGQCGVSRQSIPYQSMLKLKSLSWEQIRFPRTKAQDTSRVWLSVQHLPFSLGYWPSY